MVVKDEDIVDLGLGVFRGFRRRNILEFKSPDDELSESVLWKAAVHAREPLMGGHRKSKRSTSEAKAQLLFR